MARRRGRRGRGSFKIPVVSTAILAAQAFDAYNAAGGNIGAAVSRFASYYTGYEAHTRTWQPAHLAIGYGPWIIKRFVMPIARPRVPLRGLPISLS